MSIFSSLAGGLWSLVNGDHSAKTSYNYNRLLAQQQQEYARENAETEYNRQRDLMQDSFGLQKQGMQAAGINANLMNGSTPSAPSVNSIAAPPSQSVSSSADSGFMTAIPSVLSLLTDAWSKVKSTPASVKNTEADTNVKNKEADKKVAETEKIGAEVKNINEDTTSKVLGNQITQETMNVAIDKAFAEFDKLQADTNLSREQRDKIANESDLLKQQLRLTTFDVDHVAERFKNEQGKLRAEIGKLKAAKSLDESQKALNDITKKFHEMGIGISNDLLGTAIAVLGSGNTKLFENAVSTLKQLFNMVVPSASELVDEIGDTIKDKVTNKTKGALKAVTKSAPGMHFGQSQR